VGVGQPGVQRRQTDLGTVAEQKEYERDIEQCRVEGGPTRHQNGPHHGIEPLPDHRPRRHVDEDGAEQRKGDAHAAEDEIFPRRLERFVRAIDADHEHGRERREFDRHPHHADIVGDEREIHREHQHLVHRVVEAQHARSQAPDLEFMADIARAEHAGGEADESRQHDEDDC
jgi:hypothetical protein